VRLANARRGRLPPLEDGENIAQALFAVGACAVRGTLLAADARKRLSKIGLNTGGVPKRRVEDRFHAISLLRSGSWKSSRLDVRQVSTEVNTKVN
jgi:hypothetical protein